MGYVTCRVTGLDWIGQCCSVLFIRKIHSNPEKPILLVIDFGQLNLMQRLQAVALFDAFAVAPVATELGDANAQVVLRGAALTAEHLQKGLHYVAQIQGLPQDFWCKNGEYPEKMGEIDLQMVDKPWCFSTSLINENGLLMRGVARALYRSSRKLLLGKPPLIDRHLDKLLITTEMRIIG